MANLEIIRQRLLHATCGKFDLAEALFPESFLLTQRPRVIFDSILHKLELSKADVNKFTFYSWLRRYRCQKNNHGKKKYSQPNTWKDFEITDPEKFAYKGEDDVNFVSVNYKKNIYETHSF